MIDYLRAGMLFSQMKRNQWRDPGELRSIAETKLSRILHYAEKNVPYYSRKLKGLKLRTIDDLRSLPITQKSDIRADPESFIGREYGLGDLHSLYTSGSTGMPLRLYYSKNDSLYGFALKYFSLTECGFGPSDFLVNMMVSTMPRHFLDRILFRADNVSPFLPEEQKLAMLARLRPDVVISFPSTLIAMSSVNDSVSFGRAITASEVLSQNARHKIEKSFSCTVRNYYGTNECWSIGWECERGRMHINSDSIIVEILDERGRPANRGNVVITSLWRYSMPIIRYNLGDISSFEGRCPCGRGLAVLGPIEGRANAVLSLPSGKLASWIHVQQQLKKIYELLQFQGIQESDGDLTIKIIPERASPALAERVRKAAVASLPEPMKVKVEVVKSIPRGKSGKVVDFISRMG